MLDNYSNSQLKLITDGPLENSESLEWKYIRRERLINSLNKINFKDEQVTVNFRHQTYNTFLSLSAQPEPSLDVNLDCRWVTPSEYNRKLSEYTFENLSFSDGLKQVFVEAVPLAINNNGIRLSLPESAIEIFSRKVRRHECRSVSVQLSWDGIVIEGNLVSFSSASFSVNVSHEYKYILLGKNQNANFNIILKNDLNFVYSGICEVFRLSANSDGFIIVLKPLKRQIQRFKTKKHRSLRHKLQPMPRISFIHPLIGKEISFQAFDISGSGFSVEEDTEESTLIPGLIIPDLNIELMDKINLKCSSQIIYRNIDDAGGIRCGFAVLDMNIRDQISLSSLLHQVKNKNCYVSTKVDVDELWDFFFETNFIYPAKYSLIHNNKDEFKNVYKKLYEVNPDFAINFMYKDKGEMLAYMSMFRFFKKTWLINHHAAKSSKRSKAGLVVLEQISRFINESHQFHSTFMDYVACYFRPENKFPNLVFGGVVTSANDIKKCSIDQFAYLPINKKYLCESWQNRWDFTDAVSEDIETLELFYENSSGGLTLKGLDLTPTKYSDEEINELYHQYGFKKARRIFSLRNKNKLIAVFVANMSDIGLNMSDLTNCIKIFIFNPDKLPIEVFTSSLNEVCKLYENANIPIMIYPTSYAERNAISNFKKYNLWVLDVQNIGDIYYDHLEKLLRFSN